MQEPLELAPSRCWELNLGLLLEQLVLLVAEPSLQSPNNILNIYSWGKKKDVDHVKRVATLLGAVDNVSFQVPLSCLNSLKTDLVEQSIA